jgi:hypothetical protein
MSISVCSPSYSLKTLMAIFRRDLASYDKEYYVSTRTNPVGDTGRWQFSINGVLTPSKEVGSNAESWAEKRKAFHAISCTESSGNINHSEWKGNLDQQGKFLIGLDLKLDLKTLRPQERLACPKTALT